MNINAKISLKSYKQGKDIHPCNSNTGSPAQNNQRGKKKLNIPTSQKGKLKLPLFLDDIQILYYMQKSLKTLKKQTVGANK